MDLSEFIENGNVESYVLGLASEEEAAEMAMMLKKHPELRAELEEVERKVLRLSFEDAVMPPKELRTRTVQPFNWADTQEAENKKNYTFINIQPDKEKFITVHKVWKWIFLISFLLFKLCLFFAVFFYFKYRQIETRNEEREKIKREQQQQQLPR